MIEIDGSHGEGGGQILRTSLSLAALNGETVRFSQIRANRRKPGLMRQHLACARAVAEITGGALSGAELNSQNMIFEPGKIRAGSYCFVVGSAGSAILIAQTVLPCLLHADGASRVRIEGGTHAANAPIYDFFERVCLPCLRRMGANVSARLESTGFYPAGGGAVILEIQPVKSWRRLEITERGALKNASLTALSHGIDSQIGVDEIRFCESQLGGDMSFKSRALDVDSPGPGNVLFAELEYENITELFSVCGEFDISRKEVGDRVVGMVWNYLRSGVPVWLFLADQLLLPMSAGAGGKYFTATLTRHTSTNIDVIKKFMDVEIVLENHENGKTIIEVRK